MNSNRKTTSLTGWIEGPVDSFVDELGCGLYPRSFVAELANKHDIRDHAKVISLWRLLEFSGADYHSDLTMNADSTRPSEYRRWLNRVGKKAADLRELISFENNGLGRDYLEFGSDQLQRSFYRPENRAQFSKEQLESIADIDTIPPALEKFEQYLKYLEYAVAHTIDILPVSQKGPKEATPLKRWIDRIHNFWTEKLDRKATVDAEDGALLTRYGVFVSDCILPLEPSALTSGSRPNLASQLRKHLSSRNVEESGQRSKSD